MVPAELQAELRLSELRVESGDLVDPELADRFCDVLYRVPTVHGEDHFVWLLLEHQSTVEPLMGLRLLEYMVRIWSRIAREDRALRRLPAIVPVVLTHAPGGWSAPTRFRELLDGPAGSMRSLGSLPDFEYLVDDLTRLTPEAIAARPASAAYRLVLWSLQSRGRVEPLQKVAWREAFLQAWTGEGRRDLVRAVIEHVSRSAGPDDSVALQAAQEADSEMEKIVSTFVEEWMREGEARGRAQGQAEGRAEGQAEVCSRLLAHKFGPLPEEVQLRIRGATPEQLLAWSERILDAGTLEAVFDD